MDAGSLRRSQVPIRWRGRDIQIEVQAIQPATARAEAPLLVFLHEGLGSVSMWRDFPERLCMRAGLEGIVYSRPGYGHSTPRAPDERWQPDFMHQQAHEVLPALLRALGIDPATRSVVLFGHSDGGSISLLRAAHPDSRITGAVVMAPHILVEDVSISSIREARVAYGSSDLRSRLARHHAHVDSAFYGWNEAWLDPAFRSWTIEEEIRSIRCPLLAIQGVDDEYGTLEQIRGIARRVPQTQLLEIPQCRHSPHRDQPEVVIDATLAFLQRWR